MTSDSLNGAVTSPPLTAAGGAWSAERANLDDHIYSRVKAMIVDGTLLPGERIVSPPDALRR